MTHQALEVISSVEIIRNIGSIIHCRMDRGELWSRVLQSGRACQWGELEQRLAT
jgi:hypothetical protein